MITNKSNGILRCYLCGTPMKFFLEKLGYRILVCPSCGLGMTEFKEDYEKFIKEFYGKGYFTGRPEFGAFDQYKKDKPYIIKNNASVLKQIMRYKKTGKLLDAGCAMGFFVEHALKKGFDAHGFDPSDFAITHASKHLDGRLKEGSISEIMYPEKSFDIITLHDVFEHLDDPINSISRIRKFLKDDGIIAIATGDRGSMAAKILKKRWTFYIPPQHLFFFTKKTMTETLKRAGLKPLKWFRVGKWLSLGYVLHLADSSSGFTAARYLHDLAKQMRLARLPLYIPLQDNMVVIAGKDGK